jgi:hypothetical protein
MVLTLVSALKRLLRQDVQGQVAGLAVEAVMNNAG